MKKESVKDFIKRKNEQFKNELLNRKHISMKDIGRKGKFYFTREAWVFVPQSNLKDKVFIFERLKKERFSGKLAYRKSWNRGDIEYRIGYFIVGKIRKAKGRWIWGQFCPMIPIQDFDRLITSARREKVLI